MVKLKEKMIEHKNEHQVEVWDLAEAPPSTEVAHLLDYATASKYLVIPLKQEKGRLWLAMANPTNHQAIEDLQAITGLFVEPVFSEESDIRYQLNRLYGMAAIETIASQFLVDENLRKTPINTELRAQIQSAPTVQLVDSLIESAFLNKASDIHIEPYENILRARFRIDGHLTNSQNVNINLLPNVISRLKIMAGMNIADKRMPQDGHFSLRIHEENIDFRLSTLPTLYGEKAVIRLLYGQHKRFKLHELGFFKEDLPVFERLLQSPYGAVIITGPTGSGKTTTLTSFMAKLNSESQNIVTVEDPVENPIEGINHVAIDVKVGLDFPRALRHILRQDPDIIMVGEIRDNETAAITAQAAITGHLVLSTLHTNDAKGVFPRLVDMEVEPFMVAASLNAVIAQRLVRRLCPLCKVASQPKSSEAEWLKLPIDASVYIPRENGCNQCGNTGYKGRFAIYEYILIDETMRREMAAVKYEAARVESIMASAMSASMLENGSKNVLEGNTSADEIIREVFRR